MDWWQVVLTSTVVAGVVSGAVSLFIAKSESRDRQAQLALEREKWEHERTLPDKERERLAYADLLAVMDKITDYANQPWVGGMPYEGSEHDERMDALLSEGSRAVQQVALHGSPKVEWIGRLTINTFVQYVWAMQTGDDVEEPRNLLLTRQQSTTRLIKQALAEHKV